MSVPVHCALLFFGGSWEAMICEGMAACVCVTVAMAVAVLVALVSQ